MQLLNPLGLILIALTGLVILFHALRPRYMQQKVPSLLLWHQVSEALALHARWRRVVSSLLLFLHLLLVLVLAFALAHPVMKRLGTSRLHVHIVDASASMLTQDVAPNRFAVAIQEALEAMQSEPGPWLIIQADAAPHIAYEGNSRAEAAEALSTLQSKVATTNWEGVADLLATLEAPSSSIVLWTDGVTDPTALAPLAQAASERLAVRLVGTASAHNVGIIAFDARRTGEDPHRYEVLLTLRNFTRGSAAGSVRVATDDTELLNTEFTLSADEEQSYIIPVSLHQAQVLTARLEVADHFPLDDMAQLTVRQPQITRVALVGPGNRYLQDGLRVFPQVDFDLRLLVGAADGYHVRIYDQLPPDNYPGTRLVFAPPGVGPEAEHPVIVWWDPVHPLTRYIDWGSVHITRARALPVSPTTQVLVDSSAGPMLTLEETESGALIQVGFSLEESDLARRVAFPIFLDNLLRFAHPSGWERSDRAVLPPLSEAALERRIEAMEPGTVAAETTIVERPLWRSLVIVAIILLLIEGWLFQHRARGPARRLSQARSARHSKGGVG